MDDSSINRELKQKLNFSCCEEGSANDPQEAAPEGWEAGSHTPERAGAQGPEAGSTPPRTPLAGGPERPTVQEKDAVSPEPALRTRVSESPKCPATPDPPGDRSELHCESPFTPKVSTCGGGGPGSFRPADKEDSVLYADGTELRPSCLSPNHVFIGEHDDKFQVVRKQN